LFELSEGDVQLPKLFRQTVPLFGLFPGKTVVTELVAGPHKSHKSPRWWQFNSRI